MMVSDVTVHMVQCPICPGRNNMVVEFAEYKFQTCLIKVPSNNMGAPRVLSLLLRAPFMSWLLLAREVDKVGLH